MRSEKESSYADKPAMEVRDLHFAYGKNKVLKGVSLKIEEGKITTIMGANGCGKSTLFALMTKNLYPKKGIGWIRVTTSLLEVKKGQVVAIVEAMKLMNEIESEVDGVIAEVLVKNGEMVDYGKPLFRVKA